MGKNDTTFKYSENELVIFDKQAEDSELSVTKTYQFNQKENEYTVIDTNDNKTVYKRDEENQSFLVSQKMRLVKMVKIIKRYTKLINNIMLQK